MVSGGPDGLSEGPVGGCGSEGWDSLWGTHREVVALPGSHQHMIRERFRGRFAHVSRVSHMVVHTFRGSFAGVSQVSHQGLHSFRGSFAHVSREFRSVNP